MRLSINLEVDTFRQKELDRVRIPKGERGNFPLHVGPIPGSDDVELACKSGRNTLHCVRRQSACQPMQSRQFVVVARDLEVIVLLLEPHSGGNWNAELTLRPFDIQPIADTDFNALRQRDGLLTYS